MLQRRIHGSWSPLEFILTLWSTALLLESIDDDDD